MNSGLCLWYLIHFFPQFTPSVQITSFKAHSNEPPTTSSLLLFNFFYKLFEQKNEINFRSNQTPKYRFSQTKSKTNIQQRTKEEKKPKISTNKEWKQSLEWNRVKIKWK